MIKKGILSLATVGLLTSLLSGGVVKAERNDYDLLKKSIDSQVEKPLQSDLDNFHMSNPLKNKVESNSFNTANYSTTEEEYETWFEEEYNDEFDWADYLPLGDLMLGQSLPLKDVDFFEFDVPSDGVIEVAGMTNSDAIELGFYVAQYDDVEDNRLIYLGSEYDEIEDIEYKKYQVKAGTYYVVALDGDNYDYDNNTEDDLYGIAIDFEDNVAPGKPAVNRVDNNDAVVTGRAEAYSTITVRKGTTVIGTGMASSTGYFSVNIPVTKANSTLTITATDDWDNESLGTSVIVADVIAPAKPAVNKVDNNDLKVSGYAEVNSTVTVKKGTTVIGTGKASSTGYFSVSMPVQPASTILGVSAKDSAGNVSSTLSLTVADVIPPSKPTINRVDDNDLKVTGKAEKYSTVRVRRGTTLLGTATADGYGNYTVKIAAQKAGTILSVNAKDKAGNTSQSATYTVVRH